MILAIASTALLSIYTLRETVDGNRALLKLFSTHMGGVIDSTLSLSELTISDCDTDIVAAGLIFQASDQDSQDEFWQSARQHCGTSPFVAIPAGDYYLKRGDLDTAVQIWRQVAQAPTYVTNRIQFAVRNSDWGQVINYSDALIALESTNAIPYYYRGMAHVQSGSWLNAELDLIQATALGQKNGMDRSTLSEVYQWLGRTYRYLGNKVDARTALGKAVQLDRTNSMAYVDSALLERTENPDSARAYAQMAIEADLRNVWAYLTLSELNLDAGNFEDALEQARWAIKLQPSSELPYLLASRAAHQADEVEMALDFIDAGLRASGTRTDLLCLRYRFTQDIQGSLEQSKTLDLLKLHSIAPETCEP